MQFRFHISLLSLDKPSKFHDIFPYFRQGNGHERDFIDDPNVYIMDVYNFGIYPRDTYAKSKWHSLKYKKYF